MGAVQTGSKIKEALLNGVNKTKEFLKKVAQVVKKVLIYQKQKILLTR
jgi:hypothetical protein